MAHTDVTIGLRDPVDDRLCGRFELEGARPITTKAALELFWRDFKSVRASAGAAALL
ncbi:hypothetical protein [Paraburkholderia hospita]|uniref:hypothetical protein n=1 Tax=Paraburkholderia hospita TaxID=169430 RepID=UPI0015921119|nr:hypothetical protein [Paraburkholderia hospita]